MQSFEFQDEVGAVVETVCQVRPSQPPSLSTSLPLPGSTKWGPLLSLLIQDDEQTETTMAGGRGSLSSWLLTTPTGDWVMGQYRAEEGDSH